MALIDDIDILAQVPLFAGMETDQLRLIAFGADHRTVAAGQVLFREHAPAECAYVVIRGAFELAVTGRSGQSVVETEVGPGVMLSELALITMVERKFTAVATQDSEVIRITRSLFHRLLEEYPSMARHVEGRIKDTLAALVEGSNALSGRFQ
ncbi:cyclic nucleotide-binding domain-containing protein [Peteryoungia desertarenae]|uniref:Cyclic nucleotide-binding domain-containing protein n=1 Tax=Peteryoungia desertarenae TaxID=1813451 RepID=A0ABX6QKE0_9HYPH|nr:cyclic nucleotide-binding domain-containing protein [Peteryoungia desertarenae]QLF68791.1 cyclic nucleotide-binding domain-containing protein [Peteryoungia desertarenae]